MSARIRQLASASEIGLFLQLPYTLNHELEDDLATGRRRPEWLWIAESGGRVVGRAGYWSAPDAEKPAVLDIFDVDPAHPEAGDALLEAALPIGGKQPDFLRFVPADWRESEDSHRQVSGLMSTLERTGARLLAERLRLSFAAGTALPADSGRLSFRPVSGRDELLPLMEDVLRGTLDAHSNRDLQTMTAHEAATDHFDGEFALFGSPREWWQVGLLPSGEPAGFVIPARNTYHHIIAYIGVLPAHRGHGYISDLLARGTRTLMEAGAPHIRAATDVANVPMAQAFQRAGYVNFERAITMTWSKDA